ncbi:MAG: hypothetical protein ACKVOU_01740 [Cytophagales bacterium]
MSFFDLFATPEKKKGKSHLRNLLSMAMADGKIDNSEFEFLTKIAHKYNVSASELDQIKTEVSKKGGFAVEKDGSSFEQIFDLIKMMMIDNNINPNELKMCKIFAKKIGFASDKVDELIESVVQNISIGHSFEETKLRISYLIKD